MEASSNHGKALNDTNSSCSSMSSQNPCGETFVTSTREVLRPSIADLIDVFLNQFPGFGDSLRLQAVGRMQFHGWLDPELRLAFGMLHMNVSTRLFARKEVEPKPLHAQYRGTHSERIAQSARR